MTQLESARKGAATREMTAVAEAEGLSVAGLMELLAAGKVVILDRYYFSSMAYQGCRGFDPAEIRRLNEAIAPVPDLLLILDVDVDVGLARIGARGDTANEFEKRDSLQRCREIFLSLKDEPFARIIPSDCTLDEVTERIQQAIGQAAADRREPAVD